MGGNIVSKVLKYKNYWATVEFDAEEEILHGRVEGISALVTFESEDAKEVEKEFHAAVDDYEAFCHAIGREPEKSFSGSFNVRVTPELHRECCEMAAFEGLTLNQFIQKALKTATESNLHLAQA